ncbi:MAG: cytochrome P450 [Chloroflexi bacterium]|nr:cytochrome P450 [Chloroflexota bacterium]MDA1004523.1 cytochrome P450 [Chloroflexota bacterium]
MEIAAFTPDAAWLNDPYPSYRKLREHDPVHWSEPLGHWVLTRYTDVVAVLKDRRVTAGNRPPQRRWGRATMMVTADPPEHARLRRPVTHRFSAGSVQQLRPRIQEVVDALLDEVDGREEIDASWDVARQLPRTIIAEMMGVPLEPRRVAPRAYEAAADDGPMLPPRREAGSEAEPSEQDRVFLRAIEAHREELADDVLNDLIESEAGHRLSAEELLDTAVILYGAGQETTANVIGTGLHALLTHPEQLAQLRDDPGVIHAATDELLRFASPVHTVRRRALADVAIGDTTIPAGAKVLCMLTAANRDPEVFAQPERLDLGRAENYHIAFGSAVHTCLGGLLARAETEIAIGTLVRRYPALALAVPAADVQWGGSLVIRGVRRLPVSLH